MRSPASRLRTVLLVSALPLVLSQTTAGASVVAGPDAGPRKCAQPSPLAPGACVCIDHAPYCGLFLISLYYGTVVADACTPGTKPGPTDTVCELRP